MTAIESFPIFLSFKVAIYSTISVGIVGTILAYIFATKKFFGKALIEVAVTLPLILPPTVTGYYLMIFLGNNSWLGNLLNFEIIFTWKAAVISSFVVSLPLMVRTLQLSIETVDPAMINSAYMLGYNGIQTFFKVVLPLAKKGLVAGILLSFARAMGEFGATLMFAGNISGKTNTMPLEIYSAVSVGEWETAHWYVVILTFSSFFFLITSNLLSQKRKI